MSFVKRTISCKEENIILHCVRIFLSCCFDPRWILQTQSERPTAKTTSGALALSLTKMTQSGIMATLATMARSVYRQEYAQQSWLASTDIKFILWGICTVGWGNFLQKHASYCGNQGMTHKDEKWQNKCSTKHACACASLFLSFFIYMGHT